ncbi:MAG: ABC transporter permease [Nigerium sp.]|nr:ABC transporter permease [Nigerium sp.]
MTTMTTTTAPGRSPLGRIGALLAENTAYVALVLLALVGSTIANFASAGNVSSILYQYSVIGLLAFGQLIVVLTSGIDLAQGSMVALGSVVLGLLVPGAGVGGAAVIAVLMIALFGMISGLLVAFTDLPPFIVTLGMLGIASGLALTLADAKPVIISDSLISDIGSTVVAGIFPIGAVFWIILGVVLSIFLGRHKVGRYFYAIGGTAEGSRISGVPVRFTTVLAYTISGLCAGIAAILYAGNLGIGNPTGGAGYELEAIAAVLIGGASLAGGHGRIGTTAAGVLVLGCISSILDLSGVPQFWQGTIKGIVLLLAVVLGQIKLLRSAR